MAGRKRQVLISFSMEDGTGATPEEIGYPENVTADDIVKSFDEDYDGPRDILECFDAISNLEIQVDVWDEDNKQTSARWSAWESRGKALDTPPGS